MKQFGLFDEGNCLRKLSKLGDQLEKLNLVIDWRLFEEILNGVFTKGDKGAGGRLPYNYMLMFPYNAFVKTIDMYLMLRTV